MTSLGNVSSSRFQTTLETLPCSASCNF
uniref:Uncharacterized protein n=1 Tax=Anguilla anguilla TaxID=7936 RepID=A0A0E9S4G6_ANGAN